MSALVALVRDWRAPIDARLEARLPLSTLGGAERLNEAVKYAVFRGGRRWRPVLTLLGARLTGAPADAALEAACGVEFVHTASLVLDDLPGMDDGLERRGRPTVHCRYGEGVAMLAALALLNRGYELFATLDARVPGGGGLLAEATRAIGADGMIGGQAADLGDGATAPLASRQRKTVTLVRLAAAAGALAGGAPRDDVGALSAFGESLGDAYQVPDDLLDADAATTAGKTPGQDVRHGRASWTRGGAAAARDAASAATASACDALRARFGDHPDVALLVDAAALILDIAGAPKPMLRAG